MGVLARVDAPLNYLAELAERPFVHVQTPPPGQPRQTTRVTQHTLPVADAREEVAELSLDHQGVVLVRESSSFPDFYDPDRVRESYYPEIERLVARTTGAPRVMAFDHNVRCAARSRSGQRGVQMPVKFAHNDYTARSAPQRVRDLADPHEVESLLANRFAVINAWRPIRGPVQKNPLAVCDASSIHPRDLVPTDLKYRNRTGEVYSLAFNPRHRWIYFSKMQQDEVMLIKCYDSELDGRARFTCHAAFDDPTSPADAPDRESIEVRTLAFFAASEVRGPGGD